jgi:hypothetical protein
MAYVPEMNYTPDMGIKVRFGKKFWKNVGNIVKTAVPQTQVVNALSKVKIKIGKKKISPQPTQTQPQPTQTEPQEITPKEDKIFGLDKKVVLIGGGLIGLFLIFSLKSKK